VFLALGRISNFLLIGLTGLTVSDFTMTEYIIWGKDVSVYCLLNVN